jgi:predicted nucleic acid-binding protein
MFLVDTSVWVEYLRNTGSRAHLAAVAAVTDGTAATADPIVLEVLAGTSSQAVNRISQFLYNRRYLDQHANLDVRVAAEIYHACRRSGKTPRSTIDCLIAAIALRHDVPVLHRDRDFDAIAACTKLQVVTA